MLKNITEEKESMNLNDLLKDNPDAKAEFNEAIAAAEANGESKDQCVFDDQNGTAEPREVYMTYT